ncbi:hypothetical protein MMC28_004267 [Mycoblastus sanguinarius]|nr:hypothetical protein [Mycoblastus sanguinarius]
MAPVNPEPASVHGSCWRRAFTLMAVKICERWRPRCGTVLFLSNNLCVKYGYFQHVSEASTMQFIANHAKIPVPKVYCAFSRKGCTYIVMERIGGDYVGNAWYGRSEESREHILQQIKAMVAEMRSIPPPADARVANVTGESLHDIRLPEETPGGRGRFGPFKAISDFHRYLRRSVETSPERANPEQRAEINELINMHMETWPICFTHGDLSSLNILARRDELAGIVDWETAGWFPSYWEYTTARNVNPQNEFWRDEVDKFLEPMPKELVMETIHAKYFGDIPWGW